MDVLRNLFGLKHLSKDAVKQFFVRRLVMDSHSWSKEELEEIVARYKINIKVPSIYYLFVARPVVMSRVSCASLSHTIMEYIPKPYIYEIVQADHEHMVLLLSGVEDDDLQLKTAPAALEKALTAITIKMNYKNAAMSAALSNAIQTYEDITANYEKALQQLKYSIVYGYERIIRPDMIIENESNREYRLPAAIENKMVQGIHNSASEETKNGLQEAFLYISALHHDSITFFVRYISSLIIAQLERSASFRTSLRSSDVHSLLNKVTKYKTLEESERALIDFTERMIAQASATKRNRNEELVDEIKQLIHESYTLPSLNVHDIARRINLSPSYIGKVFSAAESVSIVSYINTVRLNHALKLMKEPSYQIKDIAAQSGYVNAGYFWRVFRKKFGSTPKQYRRTMLPTDENDG